MSHTVSELEIQRCVDGELPPAAQQELLQRLEENDSGWRDLALAYVENQVIAGVCRSVAEPDAQSSTVIRPAASRLQNVLPSPRRNANRFHWTITAASAVMGVGIGLLAGGGRADLSPVTHQPTVASASGVTQIDGADSAPTADSVAEMPQPVMNVEFADASGDASNWLLPVYAADDLGADYWQGRDVLPADIEQDLSRRGYRLDHEREFYSIPLDDGREIAVPVDTYQVRYTGL